MWFEYIKMSIAAVAMMEFGIKRIIRGTKQLKEHGIIERVFEPDLITYFVITWAFSPNSIPYHWYILSIFLIGLVFLDIYNFKTKYTFYVFNINKDQLVSKLDNSFSCSGLTYTIPSDWEYKGKYADKLMHKVIIKNFRNVEEFQGLMDIFREQIKDIKYEFFRFRGLFNILFGILTLGFSFIVGYMCLRYGI